MWKNIPSLPNKSSQTLSSVRYISPFQTLILCLRLELNALILWHIPDLIWVTHAKTELPPKGPVSCFRWAPHDCSSIYCFYPKRAWLGFKRAIFRDKHTEKGVWVKDHVGVEGKQHREKGTSLPPSSKTTSNIHSEKSGREIIGVCAAVSTVRIKKI